MSSGLKKWVRACPLDDQSGLALVSKRYLVRAALGFGRFLKVLSLCGATTLGGCNLTVLDPQGQIGVEERSIIVLATWLMLIVVLPVIAMTFAFAWKYRASNTAAQYSPDWDSSHKVAAVMVLVPCTIVAILAILTWRTTHELDPYRPIASNVEPIYIEVVALDWKWLFIYPTICRSIINAHGGRLWAVSNDLAAPFFSSRCPTGNWIYECCAQELFDWHASAKLYWSVIRCMPSLGELVHGRGNRLTIRS